MAFGTGPFGLVGARRAGNGLWAFGASRVSWFRSREELMLAAAAMGDADLWTAAAGSAARLGVGVWVFPGAAMRRLP